MSGEKPGMRDAIDRVALRIHEHNQRSGKATTFEDAQNTAREKGTSYDDRNPAKNRAQKGS
jgi:hypothetical protein